MLVLTVSAEVNMFWYSMTMFILVLNAFTTFIGVSGLFTGLLLTSMSKAVVIFNTSPSFMIVHARIFYGKELFLLDQIALILTTVGVLLLVYPSN